MPRKPQHVTDAELAILRILWECESATVREIAGRLFEKVRESQLATVQKLLNRLKSKKCVDQNRGVWPHQFSAKLSREELIGRRLQSTADELCGGSLSPLLMHLVETRGLTEEELAALRAVLQKMEFPPSASTESPKRRNS